MNVIFQWSKWLPMEVLSVSEQKYLYCCYEDVLRIYVSYRVNTIGKLGLSCSYQEIDCRWKFSTLTLLFSSFSLTETGLHDTIETKDYITINLIKEHKEVKVNYTLTFISVSPAYWIVAYLKYFADDYCWELKMRSNISSRKINFSRLFS